MGSKKFILNADDFGLSSYGNQAVLEGYNNGFLTSASLCANGSYFESAVCDILPDCPDLGIAVHLNITEGKSLSRCPDLTDKDGYFNRGYGWFILNQNKQNVKEQIEKEFRAQIEKAAAYVKIDHLDSHVHTHAIPEIFKIVCKLAKEFNINYIRTQFEKFYIIPEFSKHINLTWMLNLIKIMLLRYYTRKNTKVLRRYGLKTNDCIIGVGYTGMMDSDAVEYGLKVLEKDCIAEVLIHPCKYQNKTKNSHTKEFEITQNTKLKNTITGLGFEITNYKNL